MYSYCYTNLSEMWVLFVKIEIWDTSTQPPITCLKLTIETLEQGVKYVQS